MSLDFYLNTENLVLLTFSLHEWMLLYTYFYWVIKYLGLGFDAYYGNF